MLKCCRLRKKDVPLRLQTGNAQVPARQKAAAAARQPGLTVIKFFLYLLKISERMHLNSDEKVEIFEKYGKGKTDTGSPEAQIALFSVRIAHLTQHLKSNHKDHTTARALKALVGKRRRLLDYLIKKDITRYRAIIAQKELGIRK